MKIKETFEESERIPNKYNLIGAGGGINRQ